MGLNELVGVFVVVAKYVLDHTTTGAVEAFGADVKKFIEARFKGTLKLDQAKENPELFKTTILVEALKDNEFRDALEKIIGKFQQLQNNNNTVFQTTDKGANSNVGNNFGTFIGQQNIDNFRP